MYFGIFPEDHKDRTEAEANGQRVWGGSYFPQSLLCPTTREQTHKGRGGTVAPSPGKMHKATSTHTHTHTGKTPPHIRGWAITEKQSTVDSRGWERKQQGPTVDRQVAPSCPIPTLPPKSNEYPSSLAILLWPPAPSHCWGQKEKRYRAGAEVHPQPVPHARWSVPCLKWKG